MLYNPPSWQHLRKPMGGNNRLCQSTFTPSLLHCLAYAISTSLGVGM
jgi:hypothetical protein